MRELHIAEVGKNRLKLPLLQVCEIAENTTKKMQLLKNMKGPRVTPNRLGPDTQALNILLTAPLLTASFSPPRSQPGAIYYSL